MLKSNGLKALAQEMRRDLRSLAEDTAAQLGPDLSEERLTEEMHRQHGEFLSLLGEVYSVVFIDDRLSKGMTQREIEDEILRRNASELHRAVLEAMMEGPPLWIN